MHLIVGRIVRPHGIRGEVLVAVRTDAPESRFTAGAVLATSMDPNNPSGSAAPAAAGEAVASGDAGASGDAVDGVRWTVPAELTIDSIRLHQNRLIVAFEGVHDRDVAEELRGVFLWVDAAGIAPPDDPDEFDDHQLVGLAAVTPDGETLGEVIKIDHAPAADLLVLRRPAGGTALVPFVRAIVPEVDVPGGRVIVTPPPGLLDL